MANIVVTGVDGSETATRAARHAAEAARAFDSTLHIVCAFGPGEQRVINDGEGGRMVINLLSQAQRHIQQAADLVREQFADVEVTTAAVNEPAAEALVEEAQRLDAQLIVVGNKRVQGPSRILGSVARSVAANAHCDVYIANTRPE